MEDIFFLTTFDGLYFSHHCTHITNYNLSHVGPLWAAFMYCINKTSHITVTLLLFIYLGYLDYHRHGNGRRTIYISYIFIQHLSTVCLVGIALHLKVIFSCPSILLDRKFSIKKFKWRLLPHFYHLNNNYWLPLCWFTLFVEHKAKSFCLLKVTTSPAFAQRK